MCVVLFVLTSFCLVVQPCILVFPLGVDLSRQELIIFSLEKDMDNMMLEQVKKGSRGGAVPVLSDALKVKIEDPPRRKHMVFLGGAVLAGIMKDKPAFWVSREEYQERGVDYCIKKMTGGN
jgi:actin-related protein